MSNIDQHNVNYQCLLGSSEEEIKGQCVSLIVADFNNKQKIEKLEEKNKKLEKELDRLQNVVARFEALNAAMVAMKEEIIAKNNRNLKMELSKLKESIGITPEDPSNQPTYFERHDRYVQLVRHDEDDRSMSSGSSPIPQYTSYYSTATHPAETNASKRISPPLPKRPVDPRLHLLYGSNSNNNNPIVRVAGGDQSTSNSTLSSGDHHSYQDPDEISYSPSSFASAELRSRQTSPLRNRKTDETVPKQAVDSLHGQAEFVQPITRGQNPPDQVNNNESRANQRSNGHKPSLFCFASFSGKRK